MRVLITGGAGFIGHHICEHFLKSTDWHIIVLDKLNYASSGLDRLRDIGCFNLERVSILTADFSKAIPEGVIKEIGNVDYILHLGAETHVDRSIENPEPFVISNVVGTMHILDFARKLDNLKRFVYFSTDEVFGPAPTGTFYKEWDRYNSGNPYAASKAGAEELCLAYANTYRLPIFITHTMNAFGERQHIEKFIPMTIKKVLKGEKVLIHADCTKTKPGTRYWIHCRNIACTVHFLLERAEFREKYNIVGEKEVNNLEMAQFIAKVIGKPLNYEMVDFHSSRPGHDLRYALDGARMERMGWKLPKTFEESLTKTILWSLEHKRWLGL